MTSRMDRLRSAVGRWAAKAAERRAGTEEEGGTAPGEAGSVDRRLSSAEAGRAHADAEADAAEQGRREREYVPPPPKYAPAISAKPEPAVAVPWGMRVAAEAGWRLLVLAGVIWVLMKVVSTISLLIIAFSAGLLITALLQPTVARLRRIGLGRGLATAITFIGGFVVMGLVGWFVVWQIMENLDTLTAKVQDGIQELKSWALNGPFHVSEEQINGIAKNLSDWIGDNSKELTSAGIEGVTVVVEFLSGALLTMFVTLFLLYDGKQIWNWALKFVPAAAREGVAGAGPRAWATLTGYVRGTVIVALIDAVFIGVGLYFLKVPMAVPLAVFIFLFAFIPIVGAVISGALAVVVALVTDGVVTALLALAVVLAVQQIESHILQPFILGRLVRVHPLAVVLGVTGGSLIAGIPGAVVSVPLVAVTNTVVVYLKAYAQEQAIRQVRETAPPDAVADTGTGPEPAR
ncbi:MULTISPECIES: AI-2E family transporter [unclassified Streptomyces]|uniref:AI-2E family transporter n=1 Tax=unclassified Streptomyces TaxID=2593676 RepID=UPI002DD8195C|nr:MULTISPECIES: AI-2E family transporter [unclassified Streptomyces]WSA92650.1 AI-2E family transporter [Streptomyces sp. NBC_01795]WSB77016.1 AI-2E family transporter [Streptomyces sp. NBC_01775]WSS14712.1 AI-2E family transporter [Streptomyces sp. NBC_01186]WSS43541.1 AI-2E family transporter [Streptomyces sp. NBC_01187]